jgi:uncharacterized membrane protein
MMHDLFSGLSWIPLLLGGLFYALFSRLWFTYSPWSKNYHGAFSEKFISPSVKFRSAVIRFIAGLVMSGLVGIMANVLQLVSFAAFLKLGAFIAIGITAVALVQYANGSKQRRHEVLMETAFQLLAMLGICSVWAWWFLNHRTFVKPFTKYFVVELAQSLATFI